MYPYVSGSPSVPHHYYLVDKRDYRFSGSSAELSFRTANLHIPPNELVASDEPGRSVDVGQIFDDSSLPDIALGSTNGAIQLYANRGVDERTRQFLGFEHRGWIDVQDGCVIRDIEVTSLSPCTASLVVAVTCGTHANSGMNRVYTLPSALNCPQQPEPGARGDENDTRLCSSMFVDL